MQSGFRWCEVELLLRAVKRRENQRVALNKRQESFKPIPTKPPLSLVTEGYQPRWRNPSDLAIKNVDCILKTSSTALARSAAFYLFPSLIVASCVSQFFWGYHVLHLFDSHMFSMHSFAYEV
jgi:hypothetical protein